MTKKVLEGRETIIEFEREQFASRDTTKMKMMLRCVSGDIIVMEAEAEFVDEASGKPWEMYGASFWTMNGDRIREWRGYVKHYKD